MHLPALIVTDLELPWLSGLELIRCLKADPIRQGIPVVAISADPWSVVQAVAQSANEGLVKPFDVDCLLDKVVGHLDGQRHCVGVP